MRKMCMLPGAVLALGVAGYALRSNQLQRNFEGSAGKGLFLLTCAAAALAILAALLLGTRFETPELFRRAFYTRYYSSFALTGIGSLAAVCGAILAFNIEPLVGLEGLARHIFLLFALLSGFGLLRMTLSAYTQKDSPYLPLMSVLPGVFYCYWTVCLYRINASNPTLAEFAYSCAAFGVTALALYYIAGFAFGKKPLRATLALTLTGVFLMSVSLADPNPGGLRLIILCTDIFLVQFAIRLIGALKEKAS